MFSKFKTTTLAVITAAATLFGSGQAWALDYLPINDPGRGMFDVQVGACTASLSRFSNGPSTTAYYVF